jgi:hypothetical protein
MALIVGPILWARRQAIHDYYVVGHVTGAERDIRAASMGTTELWKAIQFYPNKLLWLHAGLVFLLVFATIIALASVMWWTARRGNRKALASNFKFPLGMAYLFAVACLLAPMAILTMDVAKSPVVANVMVAPLVWLAVLSLVRFPRGSVVPGFEGILALFAVAVLSLGIRNQVKAYDADRFMSRHRQDVEKIESMDDLIAERSRAGHLQSITIFNNRISDYLNAEVCRLMTYERHGYFVNVGDQFSSLLEVPQSEIFKQLGECEFAMISRCDRHAAGYDYPFNHEMEQLEPKVQAICQQTMDKIGVYRIFDYEVIVFARRHISRQ